MRAEYVASTPPMEQLTAMGHVILDRRQEPRFELLGRFRCAGPAGLRGRVLDLSLNGSLLDCDEEPSCKSGELIEVLLELDGSKPFAAQARVAHIHEKRIGIEFHEIEPPAFDHLSELVLSLRRAPALAKLTEPY